MALTMSKQKRRLTRYAVVLIILFVTYYLWPIKQIEDISKNMEKKQKNEYINSILNPDLSNAVYHRESKPLKAEFDPESSELIYPDVVDVENVNEALNRMNMKPLNQQSNDVSSNVKFIPDALDEFAFDTLKLSSFVGNLPLDETSKLNYYEQFSCQDLKYIPDVPEKEVQYSTKPISLDDDLIDAKKQILSMETYKAFFQSKEKQYDFNDIKLWSKKAGSSIWLPEEKVHLLVSTVMFNPNDDASTPLISFIRMQIFDNNWKEIKGQRIRFNRLDEKTLDKVFANYVKTSNEDELDKISVKFPTVLNIPFSKPPSTTFNLGAENPKLLYKDGEYNSEPVIIFSMLSENKKKNMFAVFPFKATNNKKLQHSLVKFKNIGNDAVLKLSSEQNWSPFFDSIKIEDSKNSDGNIYFAYTLDPLVIFKCSLDSGKCKKIQDNIKYSEVSSKSLAFLRGGTPFTAIPRQIIQSISGGDPLKRLQMWISFSRVVVNSDLGTCSDLYNRPVISLLIKEDGIYRLELVSSPLDFNLPNSHRCFDDGSASSIIPGGISFWDITRGSGSNDGSKLPIFNDNLGLTLTDTNSNSQIIIIKNVLNYIFGIYKDGLSILGNESDLDNVVSYRTLGTAQCALSDAITYVDSILVPQSSEIDKEIS